MIIIEEQQEDKESKKMCRSLIENSENTDNRSKIVVRNMIAALLVLLLGTGSVYADPTTITSLSSIGASGDYIITADIDATGFETSIASFSGTLTAQAKADGTFPVISGLTVPIFTTATNATISNIMLKEVSISKDGAVGAICCTANGTTRIYNCGILPSTITRDKNGNVTSYGSSLSSSNNYCGSLVGLLDGTNATDKPRVINCFSYANISGGTVKAGIVGYNNYASKYNSLKTMVMNCMFYGNITTGGTIVPIYGGEEISNDYKASTSNRLNNYNYFLYESPFSKNNHITTYNCALPAEERFLVRFEFYRHLLNSTRELATWYATGSADNAFSIMAKWVLDKEIAPYPILKAYSTTNNPHGIYPSVVNYDRQYTFNPETGAKIERTNVTTPNQGGIITTLGNSGSLTINIEAGSGGAKFGPPTTASISQSSITRPIVDKDTAQYNFNYGKVQLPYYNEVGTGNYTTASDGTSRVVTGWKIVSMSGGTSGGYTETNYDAPNYNYADRDHYGKDIYTSGSGNSGRIFAQGAYFNVPTGVTAITIQPYWAKCAYLSDANYDRYGYNNNDDLSQIGDGRYINDNSYTINGVSQKVYTTFTGARDAMGNSYVSGATVYDYAVVLVGNYHHHTNEDPAKSSELSNVKAKPLTVTSIDLNRDNEPDYCLIFRSGKQNTVCPIRYDFIAIPGMAMAHKMATNTNLAIPGNCKAIGWFEITTTALIRYNQFEYDSEKKEITAPIIMMGGVIEQFVSSNGGSAASHTNYLFFGDNVWFKVCSNGCHMEKTFTTPHIPISISGGDYEKFYLSGYFAPKANAANDNAKGYIDGGRFGEVAGGGQEEIKGNVTWLINHADIENFYAGGINAAKSIKGNISTTIKNSHVGVFCGGPKFGDMASGKTIEVTATDCIFGTYFGAGFGGTSSFKHQVYNEYKQLNYTGNASLNSKMTSNYKATTRGYYKVDETNEIDGILYDYEYELFAGSTGNVHRLYMLYASFSLAQTNNASSSLTGCTVTGNFYGAGSLGAVAGNVTSTLNNTKVLGNAFGAGYSVTVPKVDVRNLGSFSPEPSYNETTGVYVQAGFPNTTKYEWKTVESLSSNNNALNDTDHTIKTILPTSGLGSVNGNVTLTLEGNTTVNGSVYGGGDQSAVTGPTNKITVTLKDNTQVLGNVFGGGNKGPVEGSTEVKIINE